MSMPAPYGAPSVSNTLTVARPDTLSSVQNDTLCHLNDLRGKLREIRDRITGPVPEKAEGMQPSPSGTLHVAMATRSAVIELSGMAEGILQSL
jgi:hypothetical protein